MATLTKSMNIIPNTDNETSLGTATKRYKDIYAANITVSKINGTDINDIGSGGNGGSGISEWSSGIDYSIGTIVIYNDVLYKCNTAHASGEEFNSTYWVTLSNSSGGGCGLKYDNADEEDEISVTIRNPNDLTAEELGSDGSTVSSMITESLNDNLNNNFNFLKRNFTYEVSDIAYHADLPSWGYLECTTAGTTGTTEPTIPTTEGATLTDGTAVFKLRRKAVNTPTVNKRDVITTSGTYTAPVTGWYKITIKGGGGGGGGAHYYASPMLLSGGGGGEGGTCIRYHKLTAGDTATVVIGAGGACGWSTACTADGSFYTPGTSGGSSTVTIDDTTITAGGGNYGQSLQAGTGGAGDIPGACGGTGKTSGKSGDEYACAGHGGGSGSGRGAYSGSGNAGTSGGGGGGAGSKWSEAGISTITSTPTKLSQHGGAGGNGYVWFEYFDNSLN